MTEIISSKILGLEDLFHLGYFRPATVQRDFEWGPSQSGQVFKDILDLMSASQQSTADGLRDQTIELDPDAMAGELEDAEADAEAGAGHIDGVSATGAQAPNLINIFFLGSIILRPAGDGDHEIFDGLQRLTMLTILLAVLRDRTNDPILQGRLHALIDDSPQKKIPPDPSRHHADTAQNRPTSRRGW